MKQIQKIAKKSYRRHNLLATSIAAVCTAMVATSVTQASDIDIYQEAKSGQITLMFMLDISGSMGSTDGGKTTRIDRVKTAMKDLLNGNTSTIPKIEKISDDKVIGLSTLGVYQNYSAYSTGAVLVPARRLDCKYGVVGCSNMPNNGKTQRQILLDTISGFSASTNTPTARSYAETVAYLMGRTTESRLQSVNNMPYYRSYEQKSGSSWTQYVSKCTKWNSSYTSCSTWSGFSSSESLPVLDSVVDRTCSISGATNNNYRNQTCYDYTGLINIATNNASGFQYSWDETKNADKTLYVPPASLTQEDEIKKCSGQGVYVLTDGEPTSDGSSLPLMQGALGVNGQDFTCNNSSYDCLNNMALTLLNPSKNPAGLRVKTAVVGFGNSFNNVTSYNKSRTQQQNIDALGTIDSDVKRAAYWGIIGEGGWYSGNSSKDVVDSVNAFLGELGTEIPSVTTGSPTIPKDMLNPAVLQDDAYYQQFQPTPDKSYQLWIGNMKKYLVAASGKLQGRSGASVTDNKGRLITPTYDANGKLITATYDFWSAAVDSNATIADGDENTFGSRKFAARGGTWSQLKLRTATDGTLQRKLLTNRVGVGTGASASFNDGTSLRRVTRDYLTETTYKDDPERGYLMSLLGYAVDATNPASITATSLTTTSELRQIGSVMHSLPVLVTNKGKVEFNKTSKKIESKSREDYVLFGTTQGLLHVVDAVSGQEKFAFVPNEMVKNQKQAFIGYTSTNGGMNNLYYGIDGPWALHTEYVIDGSGNLTVGAGKGTGQKGKQLAFGGLRMGGRSYYALDLQNIDDPKLHFHVNPDAATASSALSYMGESWSKPSIGYVNWGGKRKLVMFVGGGYDRTDGTDGKGYENDTYNQSNKKGAGVYMFSADGSDKGNLLWWASANATTSTGAATAPIGRNDDNMKYSVVSEIRTVDRNGDDLIDHLYFGDLGGQLFRIDIDNKAATLSAFSKAPVRLLNLNTTGGKSPRFYDMPGFSIYSENGETFAVVSVGSGNRSKPLLNYTAGTSGISNDAIYNIYDKDVASKNLFTAGSSNTQNVTRATLGKLTESNRYSNTTLVAPYGSKDGWYYEFDNCVAGIDGTKKDCHKYMLQSEKVFGTPLAMNYKLYVSTFDSSKPGLSGDCGAGVKGESLLSSFCLPYGQCKSALATDGGSRGTPIGIGIHAVTVGNCTGANCDGGSDGGDDGTGGGKADKKIASASNYCAATGGRMAITVTGGVGKGEATQMCLIPQRWYERVSLK